MLLAKRNRALLGRLHGSDRLLRRATFKFMKKGIIAACLWPAFWICYALVHVNADMPIRTVSEKWGWMTVLGVIAVVVPTAFIAYQGGKNDLD